MRFKALIDVIQATADPSHAAAWDRSGLQVASTRDNFGVLGLFLDPSPSSITRAIELGCDFALSHHPLALKPELPNKIDNYYKALKLLLANDLPLYAAHTSLDVNIKGPAGWLGRELGLQDLAILEPEGPDYGYGGVGDLPKALPLAEFCLKILKILNLEGCALCGQNRPDLVRRIAFCGGSGASMVQAAMNARADLLITGDVKYHAALDSPLAILDVGHHSIEEEMTRRWALDLKNTLDGQMEVVFVPSIDPMQILTRQDLE